MIITVMISYSDQWYSLQFYSMDLQFIVNYIPDILVLYPWLHVMLSLPIHFNRNFETSSDWGSREKMNYRKSK